MTAGELLDQLESDPEWVAKSRAEEEWRLARQRRLLQEEEPLLTDLAAEGCFVRSVWDLVNTREPYPEAIPVLLRHLKNAAYDPAIRDGIARALTVRDPQVKAALPELFEAFRRDPEPRVNGPKWAIGNAIQLLYDDKYVEEIAALARDRSHGGARNVLLLGLAKSNSEAARETLELLQQDPDPDVSGVAGMALEKWHRNRARKQRGSPRKGKPPARG